jgi:PEP-CTERM motif
MKMRFLTILLAGVAVVGAAAQIIPARAANIITFADSPGTCGGAVMCSTNGTTGYLITGSGQPFNLSTITSWFQIDATAPGASSANQLPGTQTMAEPDGGAGGFLVRNDTGAAVTSFSLTLNTTFNVNTPSATCSGGVCTVNFTAHGGNLNFNTQLSGPNWKDCTQGSTVGSTCEGSAGGVAADFTDNGSLGAVTYTWSGQTIAAGALFDITFASWDNTTFSGASHSLIPEPASVALLGSGLVAFGGIRRRGARGRLDQILMTGGKS